MSRTPLVFILEHFRALLPREALVFAEWGQNGSRLLGLNAGGIGLGRVQSCTGSPTRHPPRCFNTNWGERCPSGVVCFRNPVEETQYRCILFAVLPLCWRSRLQHFPYFRLKARVRAALPRRSSRRRLLPSRRPSHSSACRRASRLAGNSGVRLRFTRSTIIFMRFTRVRATCASPPGRACSG